MPESSRKPTKAVRALLESKHSVRLPDTPASLRRQIQRHAGHRMGWNLSTDAERVSYEEIAHAFAETQGQRRRIFPDCNMFGGAETKPPFFWQTLMSNGLVLTPGIEHELNDWLDTPNRDHSMRFEMLNSRLKASTQITRLDFRKESPEFVGAFAYYSYLLSVRKAKGRDIRQALMDELGREPTDDEYLHAVDKYCLSYENELVRKAHPHVSVVDEELVAAAIVYGLMSHSDVFILTRDHDVQLHFSKMIQLMDMHYQAMLFADRFADDHTAFSREFVEPLSGPAAGLFREVMLVRKPCQADEFIKWLLPPVWEPIRVGCLLLGGAGEQLSLSTMLYTAEVGMKRLLGIKPAKALNTDRLHGGNCHVTGFPASIPSPREHILITNDNRDQYGVPLIDLEHAGTDRPFR